MVSSVSVTLAMALTTTTGCLARRPSTMEATRSMAFASSTEVPPNFITIIGVASWMARWGREVQDRTSSQVAFGLQQFGVQQGRAGGAANRVVREHGKLPVKYAAGTQPSDCSGHAGAQIDIETRLRTVAGAEIHHRMLRSAGKLQLLGFG